jgi:hypothetical protein
VVVAKISGWGYILRKSHNCPLHHTLIWYFNLEKHRDSSGQSHKQLRRNAKAKVSGLPGVFADPTTVEGRAAWYSFAFWLRIAAGYRLDVDALELEAGFHSLPGADGQPIGQAFLCDQLENGAGYCRLLAQPGEFAELLQLSEPSNPDSIAHRWMASIIDPDGAQPHGSKCDTSCNLCLRDFGNLPYHGLLDWRLALDMARIATSPDASVDLVSDWNGATNPWRNLLEGDNAAVPAIRRNLGYGDPVQFANLRGYVKQGQNGQRILIERHPLWQDAHSSWQAAEDAAQTQHPGYIAVLSWVKYSSNSK